MDSLSLVDHHCFVMYDHDHTHAQGLQGMGVGCNCSQTCKKDFNYRVVVVLGTCSLVCCCRNNRWLESFNSCTVIPRSVFLELFPY